MAVESANPAKLAAAAAAVLGVWLAYGQLRATARISRGTQLMAIDQQIEGPFVDSRRAFRLLRMECAERSKTNNTSLSYEVSETLDQLFQNRQLSPSSSGENIDPYFQLMRLPQFIETIGVLVTEGLVDADAVLSLYDAMIVSCIQPIMPHVERRRIANRNPEFLHHAEQLCARAERRLEAARQAQQRRAQTQT